MTVAERIAGLRRLHDRWTADLQQLHSIKPSMAVTLAKALSELKIVIQELEYSSRTDRADFGATSPQLIRLVARAAGSPRRREA